MPASILAEVNSHKITREDLLHRATPLLLSADLLVTDGQALVPSPLVLVGRAEGKRLLPLLLARMEALPPRGILPIDCRHVRIMDVSFGDESLVRLARRRAAKEFPDRYFVLENVGEELEANLKTLLEIREIFVPAYLLGLSASEQEEGVKEPELLGDVGLEMKETYQIALRLGRLTARQLIEQLPGARLSIAAASNRVTRLAEAGALAPLDAEVVEGGGRQKVFAPVW